MIKIEFCKNKEIPLVKNFINSHWKKNHILVNNDALFSWLYEENNRCNFILAKKGKDIIGLLGFIKNTHFDKNSISRDIIWLALWKVLEDIAPPGLGLLMLKNLEKFEPNLEIAVLGINKSHPPMYRALKYFSGSMEHYYITNPGIQNFNIIYFKDKSYRANPIVSKIKLIYKELFEEDLLSNNYIYSSDNYSCYKSSAYFINKYLKHPIYNYKIFHLEINKKKSALIVFRVININKNIIIRIIDFEGDEALIAYMGKFALDLLREEKAEYLDFMQYGIEKKYFIKAGFSLLNNTQDVVIPNYFEPLVKKNMPLLFSHNLYKKTNFRLFKGDGDQDRPNQVSKNV